MSILLVLAGLLAQETVFPSVDPAEAIAAAKKKAAKENRKVLVLWGANDSDDSLASAKLLKKDKAVAKVILYEYDLVLADASHAPGGMKMKLPFVSIATPDGKSPTFHDMPPDSKSTIEFLEKHKATPWKAKEVLDSALKRAAEEKKRVLLAFGAPW